MAGCAYEYTTLEPHTQVKLMVRWPHASRNLLNRFAVLAQHYRELRAELNANERQHERDNDLAVHVPHFADALNPGCATALCAALGEPAGHDGIAPPHGSGYEDIA